MFTLLEFSIFFTNYAIFLKLFNPMRFEVNCVKSHRRVISDGLTRMAWKTRMTSVTRVTGMAGETRITSVAKGRLG